MSGPCGPAPPSDGRPCDDPGYCGWCWRACRSNEETEKEPEAPKRRASEPFQPGWYPSGDGWRQQYYAGRGRGWRFDRYLLEIEYRDPIHPPEYRPSSQDVAVQVASIAVFLLMLVGFATALFVLLL